MQFTKVISCSFGDIVDKTRILKDTKSESNADRTRNAVISHGLHKFDNTSGSKVGGGLDVSKKKL